jgi:uncharacterized protein affecting Mg2+/Co2+ transport
MTGHYQMIGANGAAFDIDIPLFSLDSPGTARTIN